jgi:threonine dehydrogenase-like Zn-dependent dehydrogenase
LVQALYGAVSRGTESLVFSGRVPLAERERMRCPHQEGDFPGPVKYGYVNVGRVVEGPDALRNRTVFCLYPHQTTYVVRADQVVAIPDDVPPQRAVLAANMETALNALWDATPMLGDRISVVGAGVLGSLCAYLLARSPAPDVELVDLVPARQAVARAFGARFATPEHATSDRDLVFHASGKEAGLRTALSLCDAGAEVIDLSWYGDATIALPLGEAFHSRRLAVRSSQVGTVSPRARRRWTYAGRLAFAASLCSDPALDVLIDGESTFEELPRVLETLAKSGYQGLCHRIRYD